MIRELIAAALIGTLGALCLVAGILGYTGSGDFIDPRLANKNVALGFTGVGVILMLLEARLMVPILKAMAKKHAR